MSTATANEAPVILIVGCTEAVEALQAASLGVTPCDGVESALQALDSSRRALLLVRHELLGTREQLTATLRELRQRRPLASVVLWAPEAPAELVRDALQAGATDVLLEAAPPALARSVGELARTLRAPAPLAFSAASPLPAPAAAAAPPEPAELDGLVSCCPVMREIFATCLKVAPTGASVLILGETGTGKELLARAIHNHSGRKGRFVAVNCGAIPETLVDAELFGHERGTFTGATRSRHGLFQHADRGSLFLDEIGNLPLSNQFSLLRALQEGKVRPVGGMEEVAVDVRVIAATSTPLDRAVQGGSFREDLLYRLDVIRLVVPPLRDRPEDILHLFGHFQAELSRHHGLPVPELTPGFREAMLAYGWPGNVRELENFTERLILTRPGRTLGPEQFEQLTRPYHGARGPAAAPEPASPPEAVWSPAGPAAGRQRGPSVAPEGKDIDVTRSLADFLEPVICEVERRYLEAALREHQGRIQATADLAGLSRRTLLRKLKKHGLDKRNYR